MTGSNGFDEASPLPIEYVDDWRSELLELRELRQASIAEIETLCKIEPKTAEVTDLIAKHGMRIASISNDISELLSEVRLGDVE
jgi:hypothetical protein